MRFLVLVLISLSINAEVPHLPLDLNFEESRALYKKLKKNQKSVREPDIQTSIDGGEKLSNWIKKINEARDSDQAIRLTSKTTQRGIPVESPSKYGPSIISQRLIKLQSEMPLAMKNIIYGSSPIGSDTLVADAVFIEWGRRVSKLYQTAVRWESYVPWLEHMADRRFRDIRGFYHLRKMPNLDYKLKNFDSLSVKEADLVRSSLHGICMNYARNEKSCSKNLQQAISEKNLIAFKQRYYGHAQKIWDSFFKISNPRKDTEWVNDRVMTVVFKDPKNEKISGWLIENVEDEFQMTQPQWAMEIKLKRFGFGLPRIDFQKNVTPHVSGGNRIVMDANTELEEYGVRWTIRHEFGHILRLPDCYHEFYDPDQKIMINYQLDTSDLMCSRAGSMNKRIYDELKRVYFKAQ